MALTRPLVRRAEQLRLFAQDRLVAVIRTTSAEDAIRSARAVAAGGVRLIEVTLTVPDADEVIARLSEDLPDRVIGAGTVLSRAQGDAAMLAGARFLVSPCMLPELVDVARANDGMTMLGTLTPTEIVQAARAGSDFIKIFPVGPVGGPSYVQNITRALQGLPLVATGNIDVAEIPDYFKAGCVGFGIGNPLTRPDLVAKGDISAVQRLAGDFLSATRRA